MCVFVVIVYFKIHTEEKTEWEQCSHLGICWWQAHTFDVGCKILVLYVCVLFVCASTHLHVFVFCLLSFCLTISTAIYFDSKSALNQNETFALLFFLLLLFRWRITHTHMNVFCTYFKRMTTVDTWKSAKHQTIFSSSFCPIITHMG